MSGWLSGCYFKSELNEKQMQAAFDKYLAQNKHKKQDYDVEFIAADDEGAILIDGGPGDIADGEILAEFISGVISEGEYTSFNSESDGARCDGWLVVKDKYYSVDLEGTVFGANVETFAKALVGDLDLKKNHADYRHGVVEVGMNEIIRADLERFMDLLSEKLIGSSSLLGISHKVIGLKDDNILLIWVEGFAEDAFV